MHLFSSSGSGSGSSVDVCAATGGGRGSSVNVCVATGGGSGDQKPAHHGSSSSLTNSVCSIQSGCTEKASDNLSIKDSILDGR